MTKADTAQSSMEMTKPNCTITTRHDDMLEAITEKRFASRSEALRVAIEELNDSITDGGDSVVQELISRVEELSKEIQSLQTEIEDLDDAVTNRRSSPNPHIGQGERTGTLEQAQASTENKASELENEAYSLLINSEPMEITEIASSLGTDELTAKTALESLVEREYVATHSSNGSTKYLTE